MTGGLVPTLREIVEYIGGEVTEEQAGGTIDFVWREIPGIVHIKRDRLRLSFFIDVQPDPDRADSFLEIWAGCVVGELRHDQVDDGSILRLLYDADADSFDFEDGRLDMLASIALKIYRGWADFQDRTLDVLSIGMRETLERVGVPIPPVGAVGPEPTEESTFGRWSWGTRYIPEMSLYLFDFDAVARSLTDSGPFFAMSQAGHGFNSYALTVVTCLGPVAAFVQHGFGGIYTDPIRAVVDISATYAKLRLLFDGVEQRYIDSAVGSPNYEPRWLLLYSDIRGFCNLVDLDRVRNGESVKEASEFPPPGEALESDEGALFAAMLDRLGIADSDVAETTIGWDYPNKSISTD